MPAGLLRRVEISAKHYHRNMATKRKDFTQVAFDVVQRATGEVTAPVSSKKQESGRKGGLIGGQARAIKMTPQRRREIAVKAAAVRWKKSDGVMQSGEESDPGESSQK